MHPGRRVYSFRRSYWLEHVLIPRAPGWLRLAAVLRPTCRLLRLVKPICSGIVFKRRIDSPRPNFDLPSRKKNTPAFPPTSVVQQTTQSRSSSMKRAWMNSGATEELVSGQIQVRTHFLTPSMTPTYFCDNLFCREDERM